MDTSIEFERIRTEYSRRAADRKLTNVYSMLNPACMMAVHCCEKTLFALLRRQKISKWTEQKLLDLGWVNDDPLVFFVSLGLWDRHDCWPNQNES